MTNVEAFVSKVFKVDLEKLNLHFKSTTDRTLWYKVQYSNHTMFTPGINVLRVNPMELDKFIGAVDSLIKLGINSPMYKWDNLHLQEFKGADEVRDGLQKIISEYSNGLFGVDIETKDLSWDNNKLLAIGFAVSDNECLAFYDIPESLYGLLEEVLNLSGATYVWHNGKFDCEHLWYTCGIKARVDEDTLLKHFVQVSEKKGTHGLKDLGPIYLQAPQWDEELDRYKKKFCRDTGIKLADFKYDMIPTSILIPYMQKDCIATRRLLSVFDKLKEPDTDWIYKQLCKASNVFVQLELNGATVSYEQLDVLQRKFAEELIIANKKVLEGVRHFWNPAAYSAETGAKYVDTFNIKSPKQLKWLLSKATGMTLESTDAPTIDKLTELAENAAFSEPTKNLLDGIKLSRVASKYLDTYVVGLRKATCRDGKVRGVYNLHGTETGRLSSSGPNMQNIPSKNKDVKNIFAAQTGYKLVQLDYSQCIKRGTLVRGIPIEEHTNAIYKGRALVGTVKTKRGYEVVCTPDHRILTDTGWKEASRLTKSDYIALQPERKINTKRNWLRRFEGFFVGDGTFNGKCSSISVARKTEEYEDDVKTLIINAGFDVGFQSKFSFGVKCGKSKYVKYLHDTYDKHALRIPPKFEKDYMHSDLAEFLGGLFDADGSVVGTTISVATAQLNFAKDIQRCLLYFGVMSTLIKKHGGENFLPGGRDYWNVQISDMYSIQAFRENIGFSFNVKKKKSEEITTSKSYGNFVPTLTVDEVRSTNAEYKKYVSNYIRGRKYTRSKVCDLKVSPEHFRYQWDSFESYTTHEKLEDVYDLVDEPCNRFVANGVVVHNCELRVLGALSNDAFLIKSYKDGVDLHANVAREIFGDDFTPEHRRMAKTINFGIAYGRGPGAIAEAFHIPKSEAQKVINDWFSAMPGVNMYIKKQRAAARNGERQQTLFGRVRHYVITDENLFHVENEYINTPIQSIASDLTLMSLIKITEWLINKGYFIPYNAETSDVRIVITVHDSIVLEVRDNSELVKEVALKCKSIMEEVPQEMISGCPLPFKADVEVGYSWGKLGELE